MKLTQAEAVEWMKAVVGVDKILSNSERHVFKLDVGALCVAHTRFGLEGVVAKAIFYELLDEGEYEEELKANSQFGVGA